MTLDEARDHIGYGVAYKRADGETEYGVIAAVGRMWVFVQYGAVDHPTADRPEDLTLLAAEVPGDGRA